MSAATENLYLYKSVVFSKSLFGSRSMLLLSLFIPFLAGCRALTLQSEWPETDIAVDGNMAEWQNRITYLNEQQRAAGFMNDAQYLYTCLITYDKSLIRQIRHGGFSISCIHPELGEKTVKISFIGGRKNIPPLHPAENKISSPPSPAPEPFESIELTGPHDTETAIIPVYRIDTAQIHYSLSGNSDKLVFEVRMALNNDISADSFSLGIVNDTIVTLILETSVPEGHPGGEPPRHDAIRPDHDRGSPGFSSGGGPPGGGMKGPPHGNGGPPSGHHGGGEAASDPLRFKIDLHLAHRPGTAHREEKHL